MFDRITSDPSILNGQPTIRGMRLTVHRIVEALAFAARTLGESIQPSERA